MHLASYKPGKKSRSKPEEGSWACLKGQPKGTNRAFSQIFADFCRFSRFPPKKKPRESFRVIFTLRFFFFLLQGYF